MVVLSLFLMVLLTVPIGLGIAFAFRRRHGCNACTAQSFSCDRLTSGKSCPFFD